MTTPIALNGPWEGLRAFPRTLRTPTHRKRLEAGLERLGELYEQMRQRADLLASGMARLDGLRAGMIDQLDAIDGDADFEPYIPSPGGDDREFDVCDLGEPGVDGEPDLSWGGDYASTDQRFLSSGLEGDDRPDDEPSLGCAESTMRATDQTGWAYGGDRDLEGDWSDYEATHCGVSFGIGQKDGHEEETSRVTPFVMDQRS